MSSFNEISYLFPRSAEFLKALIGREHEDRNKISQHISLLRSLCMRRRFVFYFTHIVPN